MGLMSKYVIEVYALSGVVVRANDFRKDLRLVGYSYYSRIEFNVVVGIFIPNLLCFTAIIISVPKLLHYQTGTQHPPHV